MTKEELVNCLVKLGISNNYNEPMSKQQIERLSETSLKTIMNNIIITNNQVNIQQVKGTDLEIKDTDKYCYIMTYSFPCQDLSQAGLGKGMSDTSTRSGMLWEVERILTECKELGTMPQVLLMENVPNVHSVDNTEDFNKWQLRLEELGYKNYWQDLIATDYGIPQTRNRTFMVSILGDYNYTFPKKQQLKLKLKDMLEEEVDEKYFLSDAMINYVSSRMPAGDNKITTGISVGNRDSLTKAATLCTTGGTRATDNYIIENEDYDYSKEEGRIVQKHLRETLEQRKEPIKDGSYIDSYNRKIRDDDLASTLSTRTDSSNDTYIAIKNATAKGYLEAYEGDGVDISGRMEYHRGTVQKGMTQTLSTKGGENNGVVVNMKVELCNNLIKEGKVKENDVIRHSYTTSRSEEWDKRSVEQNNLSPTLDTRCDCLGVCVDKNDIKNNLRIRKLTPKECFRLMGVKDEDFDKVKKNQSDASLYHLAGDSIVVNVLMAIFKEML